MKASQLLETLAQCIAHSADPDPEILIWADDGKYEVQMVLAVNGATDEPYKGINLLSGDKVLHLDKVAQA